MLPSCPPERRKSAWPNIGEWVRYIAGSNFTDGPRNPTRYYRMGRFDAHFADNYADGRFFESGACLLYSAQTSTVPPVSFHYSVLAVGES